MCVCVGGGKNGKKMCVAFSFPYIKINGKHFANVKCHIKGKNMKDIGHINNDTNDKFLPL